MMYPPYGPPCPADPRHRCLHEDTSRVMYGALDYWRTRARSAEGRIANELKRKREKSVERQARRRRRVEEQEAKKSVAKKHQTTQELLLSVRSFADIVALDGRHAELDLNVPQMRQLLAMVPGAKAIEALVGLADTKQQLFEILMSGLLRQLLPQGHPIGCGFNNIVLLGPPGVGKTSLMQAFGTMCSAGGITRNPTVTFASRADLIGQYLGSTAAKTTEVVTKSLGGILMIDEVYSLGSAENRDFFAKEAIDTLTFLLDKHRDDLIVVIAGYADEVRNCFFAQNSGLERRFSHWLHLKAYTAEELAEIFRRHCAQRNWIVTEAGMDRLRTRSKDFTHYASDVVALTTHINNLRAHRVWATAIPLPAEQVEQQRKVQEAERKKDDKITKNKKNGGPIYLALAAAASCGHENTQAAKYIPPKVAQVDEASLAKEVDVATIELAIGRLLKERTDAKKDEPCNMYI